MAAQARHTAIRIKVLRAAASGATADEDMRKPEVDATALKILAHDFGINRVKIHTQEN